MPLTELIKSAECLTRAKSNEPKTIIELNAKIADILPVKINIPILKYKQSGLNEQQAFAN